jgi:hypothetical protein
VKKFNTVIATGAIVAVIVREEEPTIRKNIVMETNIKNEKRNQVKKAPGVRLRPVMKYKTRLNERDVMILFGRSHIMAAAASAKGWYKAYRLCFSTIGR